MEKYYTKGYILFLGAYIIYFTLVATGMSKLFELLPIPGIVFVLKLVAVSVVLLKIFIEQDYKAENILLFFVVILSTLISCIVCRDFLLFYTVCFIFGMKNIRFYDILKVSLFIQIAVFIMTAIAVLTGKISNDIVGTIVWTETMINEDFVERYNLGFIHPNLIGAMIFFTTISYLYLRKKCSFIELIIGIVINYMVYQKTGSRTSLLITIVFLPIMFWFLKKKKFQKYWKKLFIIAPFIIIMTAMIAQIFYNDNNLILAEINKVLSGRLALGHSGFWNYGVKLFGQDILWITGSNEWGLPYNFVDCFYMRTLLENGMVVFAFICIACIMTMYGLVKAEDKGLCIAFLALMVYGMIEPRLMADGIQPFFMLIGQEIYRKENSI